MLHSAGGGGVKNLIRLQKDLQSMKAAEGDTVSFINF